eukprot:m.218814 g.218814  ORF g.218814 m.218814 type:complete len:162 (-) comp17225_c1_seq5:345-830(-)
MFTKNVKQLVSLQAVETVLDVSLEQAEAILVVLLTVRVTHHEISMCRMTSMPADSPIPLAVALYRCTRSDRPQRTSTLDNSLWKAVLTLIGRIPPPGLLNLNPNDTPASSWKHSGKVYVKHAFTSLHNAVSVIKPSPLLGSPASAVVCKIKVVHGGTCSPF